MEKTEAVIYEEQRFLQLCGQSYKDKIQKKQEMTLNDFNRIYCVLMTLEMSNYAIYFAMELFPDEYSCAVTPPVRQTGNRLSRPTETARASLLA